MFPILIIGARKKEDDIPMFISKVLFVCQVAPFPGLDRGCTLLFHIKCDSHVHCL